MWTLIGKTRDYPDQWRDGLLTPIYKKGDRTKPQNYRQVCMLACPRKILKTAVKSKIAKKLSVFVRQFGFQNGISPAITLTEVYTLIRKGNDRVATLDLTKAYDRVNRKILLENCRERLEEEITATSTACLQVLRVATKGEFQGTVAE